MRASGQRRLGTLYADTSLDERGGFFEGLGSALFGAGEIDPVSAGEVPE